MLKKEIKIENIRKENENLSVELDDLKHVNKEELKCLGVELGTNYSKEFPCKECEMEFTSLFLLRRHLKNDHGSYDRISEMRLKMHELQGHILAQKLDVSEKIYRLKEAEHTCHCAGWCAINHLKHSWNKSASKVSKFQNIINESSPKEIHTCNKIYKSKPSRKPHGYS